jgi:hypothetical protein
VAFQTLAPTETYSYLPGPLNRANYQDFNAASGNLTFSSGQEYGTFTVRVLDDTIPEEDESVFVRLTGVVLGQAAQMRPGINCCILFWFQRCLFAAFLYLIQGMHSGFHLVRT